MSAGSITKDGFGKVSSWSDLEMKYDVKAASKHQPKFVSNAINGFPAIDFSGAAIGLVSDVKYSKGPNTPFTWIMAIKPTAGNGWANIFSTSDGNWPALNTHRGCGKGNLYLPVTAASKGIHVWCNWVTGGSIGTAQLPVDKLTIYTVWYDGTTTKMYWGK